MKPPPPTTNPFQSLYPQQTNLPSQPKIPFPFPQGLNPLSTPINPLSTMNPFRPPGPQEANFLSQFAPLDLQNQDPTRFPPPISNLDPSFLPSILKYQEAQFQIQKFHSYEQPSPQPFCLSGLPGLKMKYEDYMKRRESIRKQIAQIRQINNEEMKEKELRKLICTKPKMEEALALQEKLRKAGSNIAFQKEILEIDRDIELSNSCLQKLQGLWQRYEIELNDWRQRLNWREVSHLLQSVWNDINKLLIYDPVLLEEVLRLEWFFLAKVVLKHKRTDCQFSYIRACEDLKKKALESRDEKIKKSLAYKRIQKELKKYKSLVRKVKKYKQDLDNGMDIEEIDIGEIKSLLKELKKFAFDGQEEVKYIEEILRKASQFKDLELLFDEKESSLQLLETRESTPVRWERDEEERIVKSFLIESPSCQIIERDQSCAIVESKNIDFEVTREDHKMREISANDHSSSKVTLEEKSWPVEPSSCKNNERPQDRQEEVTGQRVLVKSLSCQIIEAELSCVIVEPSNVNFEGIQEEQKIRKISFFENPLAKINLTEKSSPLEPSSCKNNERWEDYQEVKLRKKTIVKSISPKTKETEQQPNLIEFFIAEKDEKIDRSVIIIDSPTPKIRPKESSSVKHLKNKWQRKQEESMRSLISEARAILSRKKKLPYKLAEKICSEYSEHHLRIPEAQEMYDLYSQEIKEIQRYCEDLTNQLQALTFEDLCLWSKTTRTIESNFEGGYDEIKAELWLAKARLIKVFWEDLAKPSKPICLREICNLIVESENYEDFFKGINKAIFQDFVTLLKHLVKRVHKKLNGKEEDKDLLMENGIMFGFLDVKKELLGVQISKELKKIDKKFKSNFEKGLSCENLHKRSTEGVEGPEIIFLTPKVKKLKSEANNEEDISIRQKKNEERDGKGLMEKRVFVNSHRRVSDSVEILTGPESEQTNDVSYSSFKLKKKKTDDFDKSQEI